MNMPRLDPSFSLGNIVTWAGLSAAIAVTWGAANTLINATAARTAEHELRIRALETREASQMAEITAKLAYMQQSLDNLIRKMEGR